MHGVECLLLSSPTLQVQTDMYRGYHGLREPEERHMCVSATSPRRDDGSISAEQSARDVALCMRQISLDNTGIFWDHDGSVIPW